MSTLTDRERKHRETATATACWLGALLTIVDDDLGRPLYVIARGAETHQFHSIQELDAWLDQLKEKQNGFV